MDVKGPLEASAEASSSHRPPNANLGTPARLSSPSHGSQFSSSLPYILSKINTNLTKSSPSNEQAPKTPLAAVHDGLARTLNWGSRPPPDLASLPKTLPAPPLPPVAGTKRKRDEEEPTVDDEATKAPSATPAPPPPVDELPAMPEKPVLRKKKTSADAILRCEQCTRTSSSTSNPMVTCAECYESWHQHCHDPVISAVVVSGKVPLKCLKCVGEDRQVREYERAKAEWEERQAAAAAYTSVDATRERNLEGLPEPAKPALVGFGAGSSTREERTAYFSALKKTDLVNLMLFSEAVHPGLLVDVMASIAKKHPDLPIFNHPDWAQGGERTASPQPAGAHAKATTSLRRPTNKKHRVSAIRKVQDLAAVALGIVEHEEDILPPLWPKVGHGLYAQLGPEEKDAWMYDDDDGEAFSHWMVLGGDGTQIVPPVRGLVSH